MDFDSDEENVMEEDFYSFLNIPKEVYIQRADNLYFVL